MSFFHGFAKRKVKNGQIRHIDHNLKYKISILFIIFFSLSKPFFTSVDFYFLFFSSSADWFFVFISFNETWSLCLWKLDDHFLFLCECNFYANWKRSSTVNVSIKMDNLMPIEPLLPFPMLVRSWSNSFRVAQWMWFFYIYIAENQAAVKSFRGGCNDEILFLQLNTIHAP